MCKLISVITPTFNEADNVEVVYQKVAEEFSRQPFYAYEHIFIDNASTDATPAILRRLAAQDSRVKVIFNLRNFGQIRSPYHAYMQAKGDAIISIAADLQDPPELIPKFIELWEQGYRVVLAQKTTSEESRLLFCLRTLYYRTVRRLADVELLEHVTGFGLYDREVIERFRDLNDPYPYVRGLISEFGYPVARVPYHQPQRRSGVTKNNFYTLYDMAMLGLTTHTKIPLRLATMLGFGMSIVSLLVGMWYLVMKLLFWDRFQLGLAPLIVGIFLFSSVQLLFLGVVGEYVGAIYTQVYKRPLVIERERINF